MDIFKKPCSRNRYSGKISLSIDEYDTINPGDKLVINFDNELIITKIIKSWMIADTVDMGEYYLLPYANKHKP